MSGLFVSTGALWFDHVGPARSAPVGPLVPGLDLRGHG